MGNRLSQTTKCNYYCPVCKASEKLPTISGRFFLINATQCQCNACNTVFQKELFYIQPKDSRNMRNIPDANRNERSDTYTQSDSSDD